MDSGHVIPGLNEDWTLLGAKLNEWVCGAMAFLMCSELFEKPARAMPLLILILVGVSVGLSILRKKFPDEEKGMRNYAFMLVGINPPGIPRPAAMQPHWSGVPIGGLHAESEYMQLGLDRLFAQESEDDDELSLKNKR